MGEIFAAAILVFRANVKITSLYGIFGIYELPYLASVILSIFTIIVIINAFNLIDGINGLSGSIGMLISVTFGYWFYLADRIELCIVAFALAGSILAFLKFNVTPARIFMGDTGSLLLGLVCSILAIEFIEAQSTIENASIVLYSGPAVAIAILILTLFDTLRVFFLRALDGKSPFYPDRRHIHHLLIDSGLSHMQATGILIFTNIVFIIIAYRFKDVGNLYLLLIILLFALVLTIILSSYSKSKKKLSK